MKIRTGEKAAEGHRRYELRRIWEKLEFLRYLSPVGWSVSLIVQAWQSLVTTPFTSVLSLFTISASLYLLSLFVLAMENGGDYLASTQTEFRMNLFLFDGISQDQRKTLVSEIKAIPEVQELKYQNKKEALKDFQKSLGEQAGLLDGLEKDNPIPAYIEVRFRKDRVSEKLFQSFADRYSKNPVVETLHYSKGLLGEFALLLKLFRNGGVAAMVLMLVMTGFIIASTVRLALYSRREEISIMRLVGATTSFVQVPCVIEGLLQGVLGAVLGMIMTWVSFVVLENVLSEINLVNFLLPKLQFLSFSSITFILLAGMLVGIAGSYLAVRRFSDV